MSADREPKHRDRPHVIWERERPPAHRKERGRDALRLEPEQRMGLQRLADPDVEDKRDSLATRRPFFQERRAPGGCSNVEMPRPARLSRPLHWQKTILLRTGDDDRIFQLRQTS